MRKGFKGIESVFECYDRNSDLPCYKLYWGDKPTGQLMDESAEDSTFEESRARLESFLSNAGEGQYCIQFKPKPNSNKGVITHYFYIPYTGANTGNNSGIGATGAPHGGLTPHAVDLLLKAEREKLEAKHALEIMQMQHKQQMEELRREIQESKGGNSTLDSILNSDLTKVAIAGLLQRFGGGNGMLNGGTPGVAGVNQPAAVIHTDIPPQNQHPETMSPNEEKVQWAFATLTPIMGGENEMADMLCKLAQWCKDNQGKPTYGLLMGQLNEVQPKFE